MNFRVSVSRYVARSFRTVAQQLPRQVDLAQVQSNIHTSYDFLPEKYIFRYPVFFYYHWRIPCFIFTGFVFAILNMSHVSCFSNIAFWLSNRNQCLWKSVETLQLEATERALNYITCFMITPSMITWGSIKYITFLNHSRFNLSLPAKISISNKNHSIP